jgi:uncharacterized surface protein with fasciclin (FAS1) repeats
MKPGAWRGQSLTEFTASENERFGWRIVNDGVMGGLSEGNVEFSEGGTMAFSGTLSLDNNGGFTTARSESVDFDLSNDLGLLLRVKGDGRTYQARLESDATYRGMKVSFSGEFTTKAGQWTQVKVPFSSFTGSLYGTDLPDKELNPAVVERVWILLADKKAGPFDLEIDWIRTYGKGQGPGALTQASPQPAPESQAPAVATANLIDTAVADGRFSTLKAALDAAGLTVFFQWDNKLTVFAPTDEAFAKLPEGTVEELLKPKNKDLLVEILSYHVASGQFELPDALQASDIEVVKGGSVDVSFSNGRVRVNDANLIDGDVICTDGVIHVIDAVLLPEAVKQRLDL